MSVVDRPRPTAGAKDLIVEMKGAGINPVDWKIRAGYLKDAWPMELPIITGWDVSGTVVEVGSEVTNFKVGDEVYSYNRPAFDNPEYAATEDLIGRDGCCAEYVKVAEWKAAHKPKSINHFEAGGIPLAGLTAYQGVFDQGLMKEGQSLLILGASGGVGSFAVQFAKDAGIKVTGSCSHRNVDMVKELGAEVVDYTKGDVDAQVKESHPDGFDVVYDCVGGDQTAAGIRALKKGGIIVSIANTDVPELAKEAGDDKVGKSFLVAVSGEQLTKIASMVDSKKVRVAHVTTFPLDESIKAFEALETNRARGKIVITN
ncbi:hypothetical protein SARC_17245 [Sphaeroforma arctica JP610]|uniref:Enoyl reductase (ER) domain-containing protein n=1 Tax=Sphaeroforma arctica JP610 TaxID=667725 RepID=A0A0L0F0V8_9EUKA|nr:hypothetical protein SARC_17245 [Sphaeroforma arctica JP610]KNC70229.1 hypothetical protein SARC_17245 [Sphaeroforma arctica JP610]|eukprot:XP_014144131.1 hypothetical protein SARC_17245 [Sphaeroforma arctica JP610]